MKKLLLILSACSITVLPASSVVSCMIPDVEIPKNDDKFLDFLKIKTDNIFVTASTTKEEIKDYFINQLRNNELIKNSFSFEAMDYDKVKNTGFFIFSLNEDVDGIGKEKQEFIFYFSTQEVMASDIQGQTVLGGFNFTADINARFGENQENIKDIISSGIESTKFFQSATEILSLDYEKFSQNGSCDVLFTKDVDLAYKTGDIFNFKYKLNWIDDQNANPSNNILGTSLKDIAIRSDQNGLDLIEKEVTSRIDSNSKLNGKWKYYDKSSPNFLNYNDETKEGNFIIEFTDNVENEFSRGDYKNITFNIDEINMDDLKIPSSKFFDCNFTNLKLKTNERENEVKQQLKDILDQSQQLAGKYEFLEDTFTFDKKFNSVVSGANYFSIKATSDVAINFLTGDVKYLYYTFSFEGAIAISTGTNFIIEVFEEEIYDILDQNPTTIADFKTKLSALIKKYRFFDPGFGKDRDIHVSADFEGADDSTPISSISKIRIYGVTQKVLGDFNFIVNRR